MKRQFIIPFILFFLLLSFSPTNSKNIAIGVSPDILDLGTLERGSSELAKFYVVTPSEDTILVYLNPSEGDFGFFNRDKYRELVYNYSEEITASWLKILNNPVELEKTDDTLGLLRGNIKGYRDISLILNIPKDAEPGYHVLRVTPSSITKDEIKGQVGAQIVAVVPVRIFFNIAGEAIRQGKILDISVGRIIGGGYEINIHFLNTGTVTISARATKILFKDEHGNLVNELTSSLEYVKPGEIKVLKTYLPVEGLEYGSYSVFADVGYTTGSTQMNSIITLKPTPMEKVTGEVYKPEFKFKWWMIVILIIIIILIYRWFKG